MADTSQLHASPVLVPADEVFSTLERNILVDGFHIVIDLERSHGSVMVDALEGKEYIDCYTFFATLPVGHNHPGLDEPEFREALLSAAVENPANSDVYSREFASFVSTFREIAVPDEFRYLFFVAGGSLAVENAMKAAFDWKARKNRANGIDGGGDRILHFRGVPRPERLYALRHEHGSDQDRPVSEIRLASGVQSQAPIPGRPGSCGRRGDRGPQGGRAALRRGPERDRGDPD